MADLRPSRVWLTENESLIFYKGYSNRTVNSLINTRRNNDSNNPKPQHFLLVNIYNMLICTSI